MRRYITVKNYFLFDKIEFLTCVPYICIYVANPFGNDVLTQTHTQNSIEVYTHIQTHINVLSNFHLIKI